MTMNPEVKAKWLDALRSGRYRQGVGGLLTEGKFCCLGVLCDLAVKEGVGEWIGASDWTGVNRFAPADAAENKARSGGYLPIEVARWAGIDNSHWSPEDDDVTVDIYVGSKYLSLMNDDHVPFTEIANHIEVYL